MPPNTRTTLLRSDKGHEWTKFVPEPSSWDVYEIRGDDKLLITSGHPFHKLRKGTGRDIGGPFWAVTKRYEEATTAPRLLWSTSGDMASATYRYRGPQYAKAMTALPTNYFPVLTPTSDILLDGYGSSAIALAIPTNPVSGAATFIGELKEGIPSLVGLDYFRSRAHRAKSAGGEYLNIEFGWKPLVSDVRKFAKAVTKSHDIVQQLVRNSGKNVRRRRNIPGSLTIESGFQGNQTPRPILVTGIYDTWLGPLNYSLEHKVERWFSGCFTYYVAPPKRGIEQSKRHLQLANKLLGTRLTPEVLWDLSPWSWAADWVGNIGDVFHNISAFSRDGLVLRYGYVMERKTSKLNYTLSGIRYRSDPYHSHNFSQSFITKCSYRRKATPFGFGLLPDVSFSNRQWAITAALGISRSSRKLD
jgi:hypothetical protein